MKLIRKIIRVAYSWLSKKLSPEVFADELSDICEKYEVEKNPKEALEFLFTLDNLIYTMQGQRACDYDNGIHVKHRLTKYHDFFLNNIGEGAKVLDVGCGNGALAKDISCIEGVFITGIELRKENYGYALENNSAKNIEYIHGDVLTDLPGRAFDIIVLSNVLEHLPDRPNFLINLKNKYSPEKFLIRVPLFSREWRVPLKKEIGVEWRADKTHETEYTKTSFCEEIETAGLHIDSLSINWGEIYAIVT